MSRPLNEAIDRHIQGVSFDPEFRIGLRDRLVSITDEMENAFLSDLINGSDEVMELAMRIYKYGLKVGADLQKVEQEILLAYHEDD